MEKSSLLVDFDCFLRWGDTALPWEIVAGAFVIIFC